MTTFQKISGENEINSLAELAHEIWFSYFPPLITYPQTEYMVEKFQSHPALCAQIASGYEYWFILHEGEIAGYFGVKRESEGLFLSKLYLKEAARGKGLASAAMRFIEDYAVESSLRAIHLTVNRGNAHTIAVYQRLGFRITGEVDSDIGGGYFMNDYQMEKLLHR